MKILLFGKSGMLGSCLYENLSEQGHSVFGFTSSECDLMDTKKMKILFDELKPDFVLNCAAYTAVDDAEKNVQLAMDINGNALGGIADLCKISKAVLIHFSTDYVFDGHKKTWKESDVPCPINVYGESKLLGEKLISEHMKKFYIIRTSWLFGENGKNFVDTMAALGKEKEEVSVVNDQFGSPTYTKDLAEKVCKFFVNKKPVLEYGIYHITNSGTTNWSDFAAHIFKTLFLETKVKGITTEAFNRPAKRPKYSTLKSTKFNFGMRPWRKAVKDYLRKYFIIAPY
ncbi:MAG: dTDP-4-dehydrorhamnose reductase [Candidatus Peregrinibacteria bacterium]|nr:dTDP-4-dehydrorhamnose reductase [Candidatus Peregrinibacteria bacterium]